MPIPRRPADGSWTAPSDEAARTEPDDELRPHGIRPVGADVGGHVGTVPVPGIAARGTGLRLPSGLPDSGHQRRIHMAEAHEAAERLVVVPCLLAPLDADMSEKP